MSDSVDIVTAAAMAELDQDVVYTNARGVTSRIADLTTNDCRRYAWRLRNRAYVIAVSYAASNPHHPEQRWRLLNPHAWLATMPLVKALERKQDEPA